MHYPSLSQLSAIGGPGEILNAREAIAATL
jgi:hypothetical protein